jgi:hypothetical protein
MLSIHEKINNNYISSTSIKVFPPDPNKPTFALNMNTKTPEQIWYDTDYPFTMDRDKLLMNSSKPRPDIPRPPNSFILYAKNEGNKSEYKNMQAKEKFRIIGKRWLNESKEVKNLFDCGSNLAKKIHAKQYKKYQFRKKNQQKGIKNVKKIKLLVQPNSFSTSTTSSTSLEQLPPQSQYTINDTPTTTPSNFIESNFTTPTYSLSKHNQMMPSIPSNFIATANCNQLESSILSNLESFLVPSTLNCPYIQPESNLSTICDLPEYTNYDQIEISNPSNLESFSTPITPNYLYIQPKSNFTAVAYDLPEYTNYDQIKTSIPSNFESLSTPVTSNYPYIQPESNLTAVACDLSGYPNCDLIKPSIPSNLEFFSTPVIIDYTYIQPETNFAI